MRVTLKASAPAGDRAAPLTNIKFTILGVRLDVGRLPVCTDALIEKNKTSPTGGCPKGSLIGSASKGTACNPHINVFNGGPRKQIFYFWTQSATDCGGLTTGATAPYDGTIKYLGANAVINIPLPPDISTKVANQPGLYGSLIQQNVTYGKAVHGKVYMAGIGCQKGKRQWTIAFTARKYNSGRSETQSVTGSSKC
jgi:hypothetical protein